MQAGGAVEGELGSLQEQVDKVAAEVRSSVHAGWSWLVLRDSGVAEWLSSGSVEVRAAWTDRLRPRTGCGVGTRHAAAHAMLPQLSDRRARCRLALQAGKEKEAVVALLRKLAPLYNRLYDAAKAALVPLPGEWCSWCSCLILFTKGLPTGAVALYNQLHGAATAAGVPCLVTRKLVSALRGAPARLLASMQPLLWLTCAPSISLFLSHFLAAAEAVATMKREASPFRYDELAGAAATNWGTFKDEGELILQGYY